MHVGRTAPWAAILVTVMGALTLNALASGHGDSAWNIGAGIVATFASAGVGLLLATCRSENPIGWLLLGNAMVLTADTIAEGYARYAVLEWPGALHNVITSQ